MLVFICCCHRLCFGNHLPLGKCIRGKPFLGFFKAIFGWPFFIFSWTVSEPYAKLAIEANFGEKKPQPNCGFITRVRGGSARGGHFQGLTHLFKVTARGWRQHQTFDAGVMLVFLRFDHAQFTQTGNAAMQGGG